jgi:hypothetical protein
MPHTGTEPRRCHCGEPASIVINDVPLCSEHGKEQLAKPVSKSRRVHSGTAA